MSTSLIRTETTLLTRDTTAVTTAVAIPLVLGAMWGLSEPPFGSGLAALAATQLTLVLVFTVHVLGVTILTARRESGVLRRWRMSGLSDPAIAVGTLGMPVLLGLAQGLALTAMSAWWWETWPPHAWLFVVAALAGSLIIAAWSVPVAAATSSSEHAMTTTLPGFVVIVGTAVFALSRPLDVVDPLVLALPTGGVSQLVALAFTSGGAEATVVAAATLATLGHLCLAAVVGYRTLRWTPRRS